MIEPKFDIYEPRHQRRKVSAVMQDDCELRDEIINIEAGDRVEWDGKSWAELLARLDNCPLTVRAWLDRRAGA